MRSENEYVFVTAGCLSVLNEIKNHNFLIELTYSECFHFPNVSKTKTMVSSGERILAIGRE